MRSSHHHLAGLLVALTLGVVATASQASSGQTFHKTLERSLSVPTHTSVQVENLAGQVTIHQGGSQLRITATVMSKGRDMAAARALADTIRLDVSQSAGQVVVHVDYPVKDHDTYQYIPTHPAQGRHGGIHLLGMIFGAGYSNSSFDYQGTQVRVYRGKNEGVPLHVDLDISLPTGMQASIVNQMGPIAATGLHDDLSLKSASGNMQARDITGNLGMRSGSGDMRLTDIHGVTQVHNGSGDITLRGIDGNVSVHAGSGDIDGARLSGQHFDLQTGSGDVTLNKLAQVRHMGIEAGSGDIDLSGDLSAMRNFDLSSGSGDITLDTGTPPATHLDITGSDIDVHWPGLSNVESGRRYYRADVGTASGSGHISAGSGDVTLR